MVFRPCAIAIALLLALCLSSCGADIQRTEQVPIQSDYMGPTCLVLGQWKGGLSFTISTAADDYRVRGKSNYLRFHALDFTANGAQGKNLTLTANGFTSLGSIDPGVHYRPCAQVADDATDWQIYQVGDFTRGRLRLIRIVTTVVLLASFGAIAQQLETRKLLARAESATVETLLQSPSSQLPRYVKVNGTVYHPDPLRSPRRGSKCVYYRHQVTRTYKPPGQKSSVTETIESATERLPFWLQDGDRQIQVLPQDAGFLQLVCHRKRQQHKLEDELKTETYLLPVGQSALVVGMVAEQAGQPVLMHPDRRVEAKVFKIYGCSEARLKGQMRLGISAAVVCGLVAIAFVLPVAFSTLPDPAIAVERWVRHWSLPF